jgi:hypothetical protein
MFQVNIPQHYSCHSVFHNLICGLTISVSTLLFVTAKIRDARFEFAFPAFHFYPPTFFDLPGIDLLLLPDAPAVRFPDLSVEVGPVILVVQYWSRCHSFLECLYFRISQHRLIDWSLRFALLVYLLVLTVWSQYFDIDLCQTNYRCQLGRRYQPQQTHEKGAL